jgi:hypothetical protein
MMRSRKFLIAFGLFIGSIVIAAATASTYQYKDNLSSTFNVVIWPCGGNYCTGMVLEDSSSNEKGVSGNPLTVNGAGQVAPSTSVSTVQAQDVRPSSGSITAHDVASSTTTGQNSASIITGSPTANSAVAQAVNGLSVVRFQLSNTWTGTVQTEQSIDGGTTWGLLACHINGTVYSGSAFTGNGIFDCPAPGATNVRMRATAAWTGTATVTLTSTIDGGVEKIVNSVSVKDNASGAQATIKPASTAPVATDPAIVTTLSQNTGEVGTPATGYSQPSGGVGLSGWLSAIEHVFVDVWDSTNHRLHVAVDTATGLAQGVSYSSQTGSGVMCLASTNAPTTTAGDIWFLSCSPGSGGVRVDLKDSAANTNPFLVINGASTYNTVAASQTNQILSSTNGGSSGTTGDYLSHCVIVPATTSPGAVTIYDNSTAIYSFAGGASSVSNLVPFPIPVGAKSTSGGWKVTTGTNVSVACTGKFT